MFTLAPIAHIRSSRTLPTDDHWADQPCILELDPGLPEEALDGIDQFSHLEILFLFHKVDAADIETASRHPRGNTAWPKVGIFAQRAKNRPNRLGVSIAELVSRNTRTLNLRGLDVIDGTPILDIKPVMVEFLPRTPIRQPNWSHELMQHYWQ